MNLRNLKQGIKLKDFRSFIQELELKEEFNCSPYANGAGSCACRGPSSYCSNLGCNHAIVR